jgi:hypothetical protein
MGFEVTAWAVVSGPQAAFGAHGSLMRRTEANLIASLASGWVP